MKRAFPMRPEGRIFYYFERQAGMKNKSIAYITKIGVLAAAAAVTTLLSIPIAFYRLDLSEVFVLIGGFALGPMAAALIELIKVLLNLLLNGTITAGVGELANFLMGCAFTVPAALIYNRSKSRKSALVGCIVGAFCLALAAVPLNLFLLIPAFTAALGIEEAQIIGMAAGVIPAIDTMPKLIVFLTVPFNLVKAALCSLLTLLVYKKLSPLLHR